jgi:hypothetical protein
VLCCAVILPAAYSKVVAAGCLSGLEAYQLFVDIKWDGSSKDNTPQDCAVCVCYTEWGRWRELMRFAYTLLLAMDGT